MQFLVSAIGIVAVVGLVFAIDPLLGAFVLFFGLPALWFVTGVGAER